jgi:hypothetical protein
MLYVAQVVVCSQINTKHINTVWAERTVVAILTSKDEAQTALFKDRKSTRLNSSHPH